MIAKSRRIIIRVVIAFIVSLTIFSSDMNAQTKTTENQDLSAKQQSIVTISAFTAKGDLEQLRKSLNAGLDAKLTVNEIKEVLVQLYAYCGFPRSLNGLNTLISVLEQQKVLQTRLAEMLLLLRIIVVNTSAGKRFWKRSPKEWNRGQKLALLPLARK